MTTDTTARNVLLLCAARTPAGEGLDWSLIAREVMRRGHG